MVEKFLIDGKHEYSDGRTTIMVDGEPVERSEFRAKLIADTVASLPATPEGEQSVYVATGGGYDSFDKLIAYEKKHHKIPADVPSINGNMFRNHAAFEAEKPAIREQIAAFLGEDAIAKNPDAVEQTLSAVYSNECNTLLGKEAVKAAFMGKKSVAYESASLYDDTLSRQKLAHEMGLKTVLIAGDKDLAHAIAATSHIEPANTGNSYKNFAKRFESQLVPAFDEIRLYNTDGAEPVLIAEKKGVGQPLEIKNPELYAKFLANKEIDPQQVASATAAANVIKRQFDEGFDQSYVKPREPTSTVAPSAPLTPAVPLKGKGDSSPPLP